MQKELKEELFSNVTIKALLPIWKGNDEANSIELAQMNENGFELIVGKGIYRVNDKATYVFPDTNLKAGLSELDIYIEPLNKEGVKDAKLSKLGSNNRVRAVKFNFHKGDGQPIFSNGIIIKDFVDISNFVFKYQSENKENRQGVSKSLKPFPSFLYKTDETNFLKLNLEYPIKLVVSQKRDGSSITLYNFNGVKQICSRNLIRPLTVKVTIGVKINPIGKIIKLLGFKTPNWTITKIKEERDNDESFIRLGKPYLDKLPEGMVLRGELFGLGSEGSGNKNNLDAKLPTQIEFFGVDCIHTIAEKQSYALLQQYKENGFPIVPVFGVKEFSSKQELIDFANIIFQEKKCEGVVCRTLDSTISFKILNQEYDSKK